MRILLITSAPFPPSEGLGYHIWNLARHLVQQGHRVHIVTRGSRRSHTEQIEDGLILSRPQFRSCVSFARSSARSLRQPSGPAA